MKEFEALYPIAKEGLQQLNLFFNDSKTEYTKVCFATKKAIGSDGKPVNGNELWKSRGRMLNKLNITHRKHMRICKILNMRRPRSVKCDVKLDSVIFIRYIRASRRNEMENVR